MTKVLKGMNVWVLLSGGMDSAACVSFYLDQGACVSGLFIDYNQPSKAQELSAAKAVAAHYGIRILHAEWKGVRVPSAGEIVGRNALLMAGALFEIGADTGMLAAGIHSGTGYFDCTDEFLDLWQGLLDGYSQGRLQLALPFLSWSKRDIWEFCSQRAVPVDITYSCEQGGPAPCGTCRSCKDRETLYAL